MGDTSQAAGRASGLEGNVSRGSADAVRSRVAEKRRDRSRSPLTSRSAVDDAVRSCHSCKERQTSPVTSEAARLARVELQRARGQHDRRNPEASWSRQTRRRRIHTPPYTGPFASCVAPNSVWCVDFKGHFKTDPLRLPFESAECLRRSIPTMDHRSPRLARVDSPP
jgi:hypothetical protein